MKMHPHWQRHVGAWRQSGLSQAAYCRLHALNDKTFSRWAKTAASAVTAADPAIIPVSVLPTLSSPAPLVLRLESGVHLELSTTISPAWLAELLKCLA
jgi:hypothetical protein